MLDMEEGAKYEKVDEPLRSFTSGVYFGFLGYACCICQIF
jgi:hypothetical protein